MSIYDRAKATTKRLLDPARLGASAGSITLTRKTVTPGANPWDDPTVTTSTQTLRAQAFGVSSQLIGTPALEPDGPIIRASDRYVISEVPDGGYQAGDVIAIDGQAVTVLRVQNIPAAGVTSAVKFLVR